MSHSSTRLTPNGLAVRSRTARISSRSRFTSASAAASSPGGEGQAPFLNAPRRLSETGLYAPDGSIDPRTGRKVGGYGDWTTHPNNPGSGVAA